MTQVTWLVWSLEMEQTLTSTSCDHSTTILQIALLCSDFEPTWTPYLTVSVFPWLTALNTLLQALHTCLDPTLKDVLQRDFGAAPLDNLITHLQSQVHKCQTSKLQLIDKCTSLDEAAGQYICTLWIFIPLSMKKKSLLMSPNLSLHSIFHVTVTVKSVSNLLFICMVLNVFVPHYKYDIITRNSCPISLSHYCYFRQPCTNL